MILQYTLFDLVLYSLKLTYQVWRKHYIIHIIGLNMQSWNSISQLPFNSIIKSTTYRAFHKDSMLVLFLIMRNLEVILFIAYYNSFCSAKNCYEGICLPTNYSQTTRPLLTETNNVKHENRFLVLIDVCHFHHHHHHHQVTFPQILLF